MILGPFGIHTYVRTYKGLLYGLRGFRAILGFRVFDLQRASVRFKRFYIRFYRVGICRLI